MSALKRLTIKSTAIGDEVIFSRPGRYYIYVDLNGQQGSLGQQICQGGELLGDTLGVHGDDETAQARFEKTCRTWWKSYLRKQREGKFYDDGPGKVYSHIR